MNANEIRASKSKASSIFFAGLIFGAGVIVVAGIMDAKPGPWAAWVIIFCILCFTGAIAFSDR